MAWGKRTIKFWSPTQCVKAFSSGEAEYYEMVIGGYVAFGLKVVSTTLGMEAKIALKSDASAAVVLEIVRGLRKQ